METLILLGILTLAAYLRLVNVAHNPGWYTDEGTQLDIARHFLAGKSQYLAVTQSVLLFSRLPLFTAVLSLASSLFGVSMTTLRMLTGSLGVLSVGMLYTVVRWGSGDRALALLAALMLAIYPEAVLYSRFGFSYNLLVPLLLLTVWGLWRYGENGRSLHSEPNLKLTAEEKRTRRIQCILSLRSQRFSNRFLAFSAICLGLALVTDLLAMAFVPVWLVVVAWRNWRDLWWSGLVLVLPFGLYAAISLVTVPEAFLFDWQFVFSRLSPGLKEQFSLLLENGVIMLSQNAWLVAGLLGLFLLRPASWRNLVLAFVLAPILILGRTTPLFSLSFYYMVPFLPFAALGVASLLLTLLRLAWARPVWVRTAVLVILVGIIGWQTVQGVEAVNGRFTTEIDSFLLPATEVESVSDYVNREIRADDVVIASPTVAWMINGRSADFQMAVAVNGIATPHLPDDIPADRWAFNPEYQSARFVIVDALWRRWAVVHVPGVEAMLVEVETWPVVFQTDSIQVYENVTE